MVHVHPIILRLLHFGEVDSCVTAHCLIVLLFAFCVVFLVEKAFFFGAWGRRRWQGGVRCRCAGEDLTIANGGMKDGGRIQRWNLRSFFNVRAQMSGRGIMLLHSCVFTVFGKFFSRINN